MVRFGEFELDPSLRELRRSGDVVHLEPQAFDLLVHLVVHRHRLVPKHELLDDVWGHRFVSEAALTTRIKEIRRALDDDGTRQHTIRNVRGHGYRFVAATIATEDAPAAATAARPRAGGATAGILGRDALVGEVAELLAPRRCVTLLGPGGVGKSTVARSLVRLEAEGRTDAATDVAVVVELATLVEPTQVLPAIAHAADVAFDPDHAARALQAVAALDVLLVLDNCEHLVDAVVELVDRLFASGRCRVRVLATSQVRLGLADELVVDVEPLGLDDAVELFVLRARSARRRLRIVAADLPRIRSMVEHLDRLPLTIEMAAARLGSMTLDDLERVVGDGAPLLQVTHRTPTRRHRTLASLVDWSCGLLDTDQRRVLDGMAVFAGAVTGADAAPVLAPDVSCDVVGALGTLADRSLLAVDLDGSNTRYRMLETVRLATTVRLAADGRHVELRRRHASRVVDLVADVDRGLRTPDEIAARRRLADLLPEVRTAHRWAAVHDPGLASRLAVQLHLASYCTLWNEPASWSAALLTDRSDADPVDLLGSRLVVGGAAANAGRLSEAQAELTAVHDAVDDPVWRATALEILSDVALYDGRLDDCLALTGELSLLGAELHDERTRGIAAVNRALALVFSGRAASALDVVAEVDRAASPPSILAWVAHATAEARCELGDHAAAAIDARRAVQLAQDTGNAFVASVSQQLQAVALGRLGDTVGALAVYDACLRGHVRHGNLVHAVTTMRNLALFLADLGDVDTAMILVAATTGDGVRRSYGVEAERLADLVDRRCAGSGALGFDDALRHASDVVARRLEAERVGA